MLEAALCLHYLLLAAVLVVREGLDACGGAHLSIQKLDLAAIVSLRGNHIEA